MKTRGSGIITTGFCSHARKVRFATELDAKMALASRVWKDKGEQRYYPCRNHFHLTSQAKRNQEAA